MMDPIHIDLRNLSQEHLAQCKPHMGECSYSSPCVIGTLIPIGRRDEGWDTASGCIRTGEFIVPPEQQCDFIDLQQHFDGGRWSEVERIASKYIGAQAIEAGTAETQGGSVHESAVAESDAP